MVVDVVVLVLVVVAIVVGEDVCRVELRDNGEDVGCAKVNPSVILI